MQKEKPENRDGFGVFVVLEIIQIISWRIVVTPHKMGRCRDSDKGDGRSQRHDVRHGVHKKQAL